MLLLCSKPNTVLDLESNPKADHSLQGPAWPNSLPASPHHLSLTALLLASCIALVFLLFLKYASHAPATRPWHWLFHLPGRVFFWLSNFHNLFRSLLWYHFFKDAGLLWRNKIPPFVLFCPLKFTLLYNIYHFLILHTYLLMCLLPAFLTILKALLE